MPAKRTIHVNAWSHPKETQNDDNRRKSFRTDATVNSTKRQSIQVQYIQRKSSVSKDPQKIEKKKNKREKKPKWIIRKYFAENRVGSSEQQPPESAEKVDEPSAQTFNRIEFESLAAFYPKQDSSQRHFSSFGQTKDFKNRPQRKKGNKVARPCCILCSIMLVTLLLAGLAALLVGLLIKNSSTTTTTTITTTTTSTTTGTTTVTRSNSSCSPTGRGILFSVNGSTPSTWTQYHFNYTATNYSHTISFGFQSENNRAYYFDQVSIVATNDTATELLMNPNFENSTVSLTGWTQSCTNSCVGYEGVISTSGSCFSGNCYYDKCRVSLLGIDFLEQTFLTLIGQEYTVSFRLLQTGSGTDTDNAFFVDIF